MPAARTGVLTVGSGTPGPLNAITDVAVMVGHTTPISPRRSA